MKAKLNFDRFPGAAIPASFILAALLFSAAPADAQTTPTATYANTPGQPTVLLASDAGDDLSETTPTTAGGSDDSSFTISIRNFSVPSNALWVAMRVGLNHEDGTIAEGVVTNINLIPGLESTGAKRMQSTDYDFTFGAAPAESVFLIGTDISQFRVLFPAAPIRDDSEEDITINISARAGARPGATRIDNDMNAVIFNPGNPVGGFPVGIISGYGIGQGNITSSIEFTVASTNVAGAASLILTDEDGEVSERDGSVPGFTLTLTSAPHEFDHAVITYELGGAATLGEDYNAVFILGAASTEALTTGGTLSIDDSAFNVSAAAIPIEIDAIADGVAETGGAETLRLTISEVEYFSDEAESNSLGTAELLSSTATLSIIDASVASLILADEDGVVTEGDEDVAGFTLTLSSAPEGFDHADITYTLGGAATSGEDYDAVFILGAASTAALTTETTGTLSISNTVFTAGTTAISIEIDAIADGAAEPEGEEILLTLSAVEYFSDTTGSNSLGSSVLLSSTATLLITDAGFASLILTEQDGEVTEGDEDVAGFRLMLSSAPPGFDHADIAYTLDGAATHGEDYNAVFILGDASTQALTTGGTLRVSNTAFTATTAAIQIEIDAIADREVEPENEDILLTISEVEYFSDADGTASLGTAVLLSSSATLSIIDAPAPGLRLRIRVFLEGPLR